MIDIVLCCRFGTLQLSYCKFRPYLDRTGVAGHVIGDGQRDLVAALLHHFAQVESVAGPVSQLEGLPATAKRDRGVKINLFLF